MERVARALAANDAQNGRSPHLHYSEYADTMWIPMARAALSALPPRDELLREALSALEAFGEVARREDLHASTIGHPDIANDTESVVSFRCKKIEFRSIGPTMVQFRRARAAADKIRAALERQQKGEEL